MSCLPAGHLTTLNFNQWNLACPFPADEIGQLEFVENLVMANNFNLTVRRRLDGEPALCNMLCCRRSMSFGQVMMLELSFPSQHRYTSRSAHRGQPTVASVHL